MKGRLAVGCGQYHLSGLAIAKGGSCDSAAACPSLAGSSSHPNYFEALFHHSALKSLAICTYICFVAILCRHLLYQRTSPAYKHAT